MKIRLKQIRKDKKYTQQQLADAIGVNRSLISKWEHGTKPGIQSLAKAAKELGVTLDELISL